MKILTIAIAFMTFPWLVGCIDKPRQRQQRLSEDARVKAMESMPGQFRSVYNESPVECDIDGARVPLPRKKLEVQRLKKDSANRLANTIEIFPEIHWLDMSSAEMITPKLAHAIAKLPHLNVLMLPRFNLKQYPQLDGEFLGALARAPELRSLSLGSCSVNERAMGQLGRSRTVESIEIHAGLSPRVLISIAQMPRVKSISIASAPGGMPWLFRKPIDAETQLAIGKLDGRPLSVSSEAVLHVSLFRALSQVKTLKGLYIGGAGGVNGKVGPHDAALYINHKFLETFSVDTPSPEQKKEQVELYELMSEIRDKASKRSKNGRKAASEVADNATTL